MQRADIKEFHRCCYYLQQGWTLPVTEAEFRRICRIWLADRFEQWFHPLYS